VTCGVNSDTFKFQAFPLEVDLKVIKLPADPSQLIFAKLNVDPALNLILLSPNK
jgi:hypothetical protein